MYLFIILLTRTAHGGLVVVVTLLPINAGEVL